jgi:hypothetical protein|tara:strand:+ start:3213 stop:3521 length:309 start_codon:yes stop_codon:yes gene_type:complete
MKKVDQRQSIDVRFIQFHLSNPHVYDKLKELSIFAKRGGARKIGIALLFERLRWWSMFETTGDIFKLCNDYRALYARMLMKNVPELQGFFVTRGRSFHDQGS